MKTIAAFIADLRALGHQKIVSDTSPPLLWPCISVFSMKEEWIEHEILLLNMENF